MRQPRSTVTEITKKNQKHLLMLSQFAQVSYLVGHDSLLVDIRSSSLLGTAGRSVSEMKGVFQRVSPLIILNEPRFDAITCGVKELLSYLANPMKSS